MRSYKLRGDEIGSHRTEPASEGSPNRLSVIDGQVLQESLGNAAYEDRAVIGIDFSSDISPVLFAANTEVLITFTAVLQ